MQSSDIKTQILSRSPVVTPAATQNIVETLAARYEVLDTLGEGSMVYRVRDCGEEVSPEPLSNKKARLRGLFCYI